MKNPEKLRAGIDELLDKLYLTDACLLYSPSQIALASILHSASKNQENLDLYVTQTLLGGDPSRLTDLIEAVRSMFNYILIKLDCNPPMYNDSLHVRNPLFVWTRTHLTIFV